MVGLFFEEVGVRAEVEKCKDEDVILNFINEEPVGFDVAFGEIFVVTF